MSPEACFPIEHGLLSLYDRHADGTGVSLASWHRPIANLRPHLNEEPSPDGRGFPHGFAADLQVAGWLRRRGIRADVAADEDLDADGLGLLSRYRVLMTGTHPEYWTQSMLDALAAYLDTGGRLIYLGGNGFYWVTSYDSIRRHVIEVRRWGGSRAWSVPAGEHHHATTGEQGGLWRERGRPPQRLVGVGFTAQGSGPARPYQRTASSYDPRAAWIFDGVSSDGIIGDAGTVMGGAAGLEFDRADAALGTPPHALVIASALGFSDAYQAAIEDVEISDSMQGGTVAETVRADMVYFETANGGAVFSAGSIAFGGAVVANGGDNDASRVLANVLRAFLNDEILPPCA
jgi:N,N-dimethylformamidase